MNDSEIPELKIMPLQLGVMATHQNIVVNLEPIIEQPLLEPLPK